MRHVEAGTKHRPHPEEHRAAMRLEGWNESVPGSILRDGRARARPPQDEGRWVSSANLTHLHQVSFAASERICHSPSRGSRSHAENLDGSDRCLAWIGDGRMQQMRDSRPAAEDVQDRSKRNINSATEAGHSCGYWEDSAIKR